MPLTHLARPDTPPVTRRAERLLSAAVIAVYLLAALGFSLGPIFEGPDEIEHYRYVRYLVEQRALPPLAGQPFGEYHQPPLYYTLVAPLASLLPDDDFAAIDGRRNPHYPAHFERVGNDNKNLYLHSKAEAFPYSGSQTALAVHVLRLLSVLMGLGTVQAARQVFALLWPEQPLPRLLALSFVGLWPQFVYLSSVITNDGLLILLSTLAVWLAISQVRNGPTGRRALLLGGVLGLAMLTKFSASVMVVTLLAGLALDRRQWRTLPLVIVPVAAVAGWWYVRNGIVFGDPTGMQSMFETWEGAALRPAGGIDLRLGLERARFAYKTFWARFGQGAVPVSRGMYAAFDLIAVLAVAGAGRGLLQLWRAHRRDLRPLLPLLIALGSALVWIPAVLYYSSTTLAGNQGRFAMPGIAGWGVLFGFGLVHLLGERWAGILRLGLTVPLLLGVLLVSAQALYFHPAYRPLPARDEVGQALTIRYGEVAELVGVSPADMTAAAGETVAFELHWQALRPTDRLVTSFLHAAFAPDIVWRDSVPGNGHILPTEWEPGQRWTERYVATMPANISEPLSVMLVAGLYDPAQGEAITAYDGAGNELGPAPVIATLVVEPAGSAEGGGRRE